HVETVKSLIDVKVQSRVVANVKIMLNELEDILNGVFLLRELSLRTQDLLLSFGERMSAYIISEYLKQKGLNSEFLDARDIIKTDNNFGNARINFNLTISNIQKKFSNKKI